MKVLDRPGKLLSCALTEQQVVDEIKTETRRLGWWLDKNGRRLVQPGDRLQLVRKAMGRKPGEPVVVLARVEVTSVHRERLDAITPDGVTAEGFPDWGPSEFVEFFCRSMKCAPDRVVTVIRWRYSDGSGTAEECEECGVEVILGADAHEHWDGRDVHVYCERHCPDCRGGDEG